MNRRSMMRLPALVLLALTSATTTALASDEPGAPPSPPGAPIVGSWHETTTIPGGPPPFAGLLTFERGGTLLASYQGNVNATTAFTAAHGHWVHQGGRTYTTTARQLVSDLNGNLLFLNTLRQRIVLGRSGDAYSATVTAEFSDPVTGVVFFVGKGTTEARRIDADPVP
jgi:hypothetical protein